jgi:hypothetical protein
MTIAGEDEKTQSLRARHGLAGYGAYWLILEKIAVQIRPESISTSLTLSVRKWAQHVDMKPSWIRKVLSTGNELGLMRVTTQGELVTVDVPNILKYCDEYTRKVRRVSGQTPDKLRSKPGSPTLPTYLNQDLKPGPVDNSDNSQGAPPAGVPEAPPSERQKKKSDVLCKTDGCSKRWVINRLCRECHEGKENTGTIPGIGNIGAIK